MPKTIALLHFSAPPVVGGVESVIGHHARLLAAGGYNVRIIAGRGAAVGNSTFIEIPLVDSRHDRVLAAKDALDRGRVPAHFDELIESIANELVAAFAGVDVVIAHNVCSLHKNLALTAALRRVCARPEPPRLIIWHHDLAWTRPRYLEELYDGWPWDLIRQEWPEVQPTHVVVSQLRRRELAEVAGIAADAIHVVPSGLDLAQFYKLAEETAVLVEQLDLYEAAPFLLLPVRITRRKNIELAVRTMAALRDKLPQAALVVTGPPGPHNPSNQQYFDDLKALRSDLNLLPTGVDTPSVYFLADEVDVYLPDVVIGDLYRVADALFFPSREEGFGIPMLEAGLIGVPIFCADIPPLREIAADRANYFSPNADPQQIAELITAYLQNDDVYQLRRHVRQTYRWEKIYLQKIAPLLGKECD